MKTLTLILAMISVGCASGGYYSYTPPANDGMVYTPQEAPHIFTPTTTVIPMANGDSTVWGANNGMIINDGVQSTYWGN